MLSSESLEVKRFTIGTAIDDGAWMVVSTISSKGSWVNHKETPDALLKIRWLLKDKFYDFIFNGMKRDGLVHLKRKFTCARANKAVEHF